MHRSVKACVRIKATILWPVSVVLAWASAYNTSVLSAGTKPDALVSDTVCWPVMVAKA